MIEKLNDLLADELAVVSQETVQSDMRRIMGITNWGADNAEEAAAESQNPEKSTGFENVKDVIVDELHRVVDGVGEKAMELETQSGVAQYGKQASDWIDQSAEYVRQFDYQQADARIREYVRQNPGLSLLIAGGVGLMIGAILRRQ